LESLPMTLDTHGLPEEEYLSIFEQKAHFACKALQVLKRVAHSYDIKNIDSNVAWNLFQEVGYCADDECRIKQKQKNPQELEARSYTSTTYPTTGAVFTEVQNLEQLIKEFIEQNKDGYLGTDRVSNFINEVKE
jgi:hypothetical protein